MAPSSVPDGRLTAHLLLQDGTRIPLEAEETLIGRGPACQLVLQDEGVSREHALVGYDEAIGVWTLEDLQSTNGTRVNGKRVRSATLQPGDELQIGSTRLRFQTG